MRNGVVQFGERFPADVDREEFAKNVSAVANQFVSVIESQMSALFAVKLEGTFAHTTGISVANQWVELAWQYGDTLVFARLYQNGHPYAIAWVEYEE